jgi:hypothetical protein
VLEISGLTPADLPGGNPLIIKVAASNAQAQAQKAAPAPVLPVRPVRPQTNSPYSGGCDFPMFGGGFGNFGNFGFR